MAVLYLVLPPPGNAADLVDAGQADGGDDGVACLEVQMAMSSGLDMVLSWTSEGSVAPGFRPIGWFTP